MLYNLQRQIIQNLWDNYIISIPNFHKIFAKKFPLLDHFAILEINSNQEGKNLYARIFKKIGFDIKGEGYLAEKINDFIWLSANNKPYLLPEESLPQPIFADFRLELLTLKNRIILEKYIKQIVPFDEKLFDNLLKNIPENAIEYLTDFFCRRPWSKPTINDYLSIKEENQLIAWGLLFGRKVNHFGVNINFLNEYKSLSDFNNKNHKFATFNEEAGEIKGGEYCGIAQSSTIGEVVGIEVADGIIKTHDSFLEFVWRFSQKSNPQYFNDYYDGFIPRNANKVIESIYSLDLDLMQITLFKII